MTVSHVNKEKTRSKKYPKNNQKNQSNPWANLYLKAVSGTEKLSLEIVVLFKTH